jgi:hypothetical protein
MDSGAFLLKEQRSLSTACKGVCMTNEMKQWL